MTLGYLVVKTCALLINAALFLCDSRATHIIMTATTLRLYLNVMQVIYGAVQLLLQLLEMLRIYYYHCVCDYDNYYYYYHDYTCDYHCVYGCDNYYNYYYQDYT